MRTKIITPWHDSARLSAFLEAWQIEGDDPRFLFPSEGSCPASKNAAVKACAGEGVDVAIFLDDDCFPHEEAPDVDSFIAAHLEALEPVASDREFLPVTDPPSRGTPFHGLGVPRPVAASMGFWTGVGDYDAVRQLALGAETPMRFHRGVVFGRFFPLCGMNVAFRPAEWLPHCLHPTDVGRMDDIWAGFEWQAEAWRRGHCFNLRGPLVVHQRASDVWANLENETARLRENEERWKRYANWWQA